MAHLLAGDLDDGRPPVPQGRLLLSVGDRGWGFQRVGGIKVLNDQRVLDLGSLAEQEPDLIGGRGPTREVWQIQRQPPASLARAGSVSRVSDHNGLESGIVRSCRTHVNFGSAISVESSRSVGAVVHQFATEKRIDVDLQPEITRVPWTPTESLPAPGAVS